MNSKIFVMNGRGWVGAVLLAAALTTLALAGGAGKGQAAASPLVGPTSYTVLSANPSIAYQPTPGGNIGYRIVVKNGGTSVANHFSLTETIGIKHLADGSSVGGSTVAYRSANYVDTSPTDQTPITCTAIGAPALTCTISKLAVNASVEIIVLFKTSSSASATDEVTATSKVAFDSQTNGAANQKTVSYDSPTSSIAGLADGSLGQSIFLPGEQLPAPAAGTGLLSNIQMPAEAFLNDVPYVGASVQNIGAPARCLKCPAVATDITIPLAGNLNAAGPFYSPLASKPFTWTLTLNQLPNGYKFTGVYHNGDLIQPCTGTAPNASLPICVSTVAITKTSITVVGRALQNGRYQFG